MCRYSEHPVKFHHVCVPCRAHRKDYRRGTIHCHSCGGRMYNMGHDFKAPKKRETDQWKKLEIFVRNEIAFFSCGCGGPGWRPGTLREAREATYQRVKLRDREYTVVIEGGSRKPRRG